MTAVVQRVTSARVSVDDSIHGQIGAGLVVYLGVHGTDTLKDEDYITKKVANLRIFTDDQDKMNRSVRDNEGSILLISQFTLCADCRKGNRPSFNGAMTPDEAETVYQRIVRRFTDEYDIPVETGVFGAHMMVSYTNDGPVTIILDSKKNT